MAGILRYGSYVPFFRLQRSHLGGRGERAVASYDEDAVSMSVEAAREALRGSSRDQAPTAVLFATTSPPYLEKLNAALVAAALDLPAETLALDVTGSPRGGMGALAAGLGLAAGGRRTLVTAGDVLVGAPGGARESGGGDAAAAFVVGAEDGVARLLASASETIEVLDVWRSPGMPFARQWEERFGEEIFVPAMARVLARALEQAGLSIADLDHVVLDGTNPRALQAFSRQSGFLRTAVVDDLAASAGRAGAAAAGLLLCSVLDRAKAGERIAVLVAADGAEALIFEVTARLEAARPERDVARWVEAKRNDVDYTTYLKWREILPFEPPRRPDPARPAAPPMHRAERWKFGFVGSRCQACSTANVPPQRVCVACGAVDQMTPEPFADAVGKIATYAIDHLAYSLQPPVVGAVVDFEQGGRFACQLTDVDPDKVAIGDRLEMTFRRLYTAAGVHNYFWKARPRR